MANLVQAHDRVKDFDWAPSYVDKRERYPTKYRIPPKTKDPFRNLIRDYCSMEQEKDDRQYGALEDVLARSNAPAKAERKWLEFLKIGLPGFSFAEYSAMKCMSQLIDVVENAELRQGYMAQMIDEVRHTHQQIYLNRYFARHSPDPDGFAWGLKFAGQDLFARTFRAVNQLDFMGDPVEGAITLQVVIETAYTNLLFIPMTTLAARQGDQATPSVFLSIQSDEARHMANGYSTLAAILSEADNLQYVQADFDRAFWRVHNAVDAFLGVGFDYFQVHRGASYLETWKEWVAEDWVGSYISKLEPFGLRAPSTLEKAVTRLPWMGHTVMMLAAGGWPLGFLRHEALTDRDFEWFENKYPGWYDQYGWLWEGFGAIQAPGSGNPFLLFEDMPPLCRVCQMPCVLPRLDINEIRIAEYGGRRHAFCSAPCQAIFEEEPGRYLGYKTFWELWDGHGLDEYIVKQGLLRADGRTLIAQPHLSDDPKMMWTLDDIKELDYEIRDPLQKSDSIYIM